MRKKKSFRTAAVVLAIVAAVSGIPVAAAEDENTSDASSANASNYITDENFTNDMIGKNYTVVDRVSETPFYEGEQIELKISDIFQPVNGTASAADNYGYSSEVPQMTVGESGKLLIQAPETARYCISMDYLDVGNSVLPIEFSVKVNGEYPFYELRDITMEAQWKDPEEVSYDRYGNQIVPVPEKIREWNNKFLMDSTYRRTIPLAVELQEGMNELEISMLEGTMLLGNL